MTTRAPSSVLPTRTPLTRRTPGAFANLPRTPWRSSARRAGFFSSRIPSLPISPSALTKTRAVPSISPTEMRPSRCAGFFTSCTSSRESTRLGSAAGACASPTESTRSLPSTARSYFWSASSATTIRPTRVPRSSNCAALQPAMPLDGDTREWCPRGSPACTTALTSPSFRSMTTLGGADSLKTVNSGFAVAWMKSLPPFSSTEVTFTGAAARAAGAAAISTAVRSILVAIRLSLRIAARITGPPSPRPCARLPGAP